MSLLKDFAAFCDSLRDTMPLVHLWQALFRHSVPGANKEAFDLVAQFPHLKKVMPRKLDTLLRTARETQQLDVLFRMLPLFSELELADKDGEHLTGCIYDALMDIYVTNEDGAGATALIRLAKERAAHGKSDCMWPETVRKYVKLAGTTKLAHPAGAPVPGVVAIPVKPRATPNSSQLPVIKF